jgi:hypothetical protein
MLSVAAGTVGPQGSFSGAAWLPGAFQLLTPAVCHVSPSSWMFLMTLPYYYIIIKFKISDNVMMEIQLDVYTWQTAGINSQKAPMATMPLPKAIMAVQLFLLPH